MSLPSEHSACPTAAYSIGSQGRKQSVFRVILALWRILPADRVGAASDPVQNPEGRFHHDGQRGHFGLLYPSSQRPDLHNLVLFDWNAPGNPGVPKRRITTAAAPWPGRPANLP